MHDDFNDRLSDAIHDALDAPRDIVPPDPERAAARRALIASKRGELVRVTIPGEPIIDIDGNLIGMTEATAGLVRIPRDHNPEVTP